MKGSKENNGPNYELKLFISGASLNSTKAINNLQRILESRLPGMYTLQIVDLYQDKSLAEKEQIVAVPMLVRKHPLPKLRLIGDMSNEELVIKKLEITTLGL